MSPEPAVNLGLEEIITTQVYTAAADDSGDPAAVDANGSWVNEKILEYLQGLDPDKDIGKRLGSSPVIRVKAIDDTSVTFIIRGRLKIGPLKGRFEPFVRIEARLPKDQLSVAEVSTFIAELKFEEPENSVPVTQVRMGLGFDHGVFVGRGTCRIVPIGFGLDIFLGGLHATGIMIGIDLFLPVPIPLGANFGMNRLGGDYAQNFKPRIEAGLEAEDPPPNLETGASVLPEAPEQVAHPTAYHYVLWARNPDEALDRWIPAPPEARVYGLGVRATFCDLPSAGNVVQLYPVGFAVFLPGPTIILGGEGHLLTERSGVKLEVIAAIDVTSKSFALGGGAELRLPEDTGFLMDGEGIVDLFFSIAEPKTWFVHFGTRKEPCKAKVFEEWEAQVFLELDHYKIAFGGLAGLDIELGPWGKKEIFALFAKYGLWFAALIGWNPRQVAGEIKLSAEIGIKVWNFKISLAVSASFLGHFPRPKRLVARAEVKVNLPWPLPDPKFEITVPDIKAEHPPEMRAAMLEGDRPEVHAGALHPLSGRQWDLDAPDGDERNLPWPDSVLAVHFSRRVADETGRVLGPAVSAENNGGYQVLSAMTALELTNLDTDEEIDGVQAVWAEAQEGDLAQLHVLAHDPYAWLTWSAEAAESISLPPAKVVLQRFGIGPSETFDDSRTFGELSIEPKVTATLAGPFDFALPSRTISSAALDLSFATASGQPIAVDQLSLYVVEYRGEGVSSQSRVKTASGGAPLPTLAVDFKELLPGLYLVTYEVGIPAGAAITGLALSSQEGPAGQPWPFHLFGVLYREARVPIVSCQEQVILQPGRYRLRVAGTTTATSLHGLVDPDPVEWELAREFRVIYPPSLRPYLRSTTLGDSRLFRNESFAWNPSPYGIGFPGYRAYVPVMKFMSPYLSRIFGSVRVQIFFNDGSEPAVDLAFEFQPNPDGESSTLVPSAEFQEWVGCDPQPDEELALPPLAESGPAEVRLVFTPPGEDPVTLDRWDCCVSQFEDFKNHLGLPPSQNRIALVYTPDGPHPVPDCFTGVFTSGLTIGGNHMDTRPSDFRVPGRAPGGLGGSLLKEDLAPAAPFPEELAVPPVSWRLPSALVTHLEDASAPLEIAFARFAHDTGAAFSSDPAHRLYGINNTVAETTVEGVADTAGRLLAIWLRTPEPVDWRRVSASLRIRHFREGDDCPPKYAYRRRLTLDVEILPAPDGSSAFLVGSLAGFRARLPRGEYELTLSFDASVSGLPRLRPTAAVGSTPEVVELLLLQLSGENWPLPVQAITLPAGSMERLFQALEAPPALVQALLELDPGLSRDDERVLRLLDSLRDARAAGGGSRPKVEPIRRLFATAAKLARPRVKRRSPRVLDSGEES